ncbi:unnamed protein product [Larinioides sclopetarius]|uniref:Uncharacterized protein n=1 Tax=Larinioides sclopetarius TaxID=280406 RepID=A0AAV2B6N7_9ARAC
MRSPGKGELKKENVQQSLLYLQIERNFVTLVILKKRIWNLLQKLVNFCH